MNPLYAVGQYNIHSKENNEVSMKNKRNSVTTVMMMMKKKDKALQKQTKKKRKPTSLRPIITV